MKQVTMRVEGFVTVTVPDEQDAVPDRIPVKLDVFKLHEHDDSYVYEVNEIEILEKEITTVVDI